MIWNILNKANNTKEIMQNILKYKNMNKQEMLDFINFNIPKHSPNLLTNLDKAIKRIIEAINNNETITIIGDYDVDGICSTTILFLTLSNIVNVHYIIPDRFKNGYGIKNELIDIAKENNTNLIITVDNGIKAHEQVKYANSLNIDVIVTDHHAFENDILPTEITINPQIDNNYPFKEICGCMVTYKLCLALIYELNLDIDLIDKLLEFVCLATIADVMPLINENRVYVKEGLDLLSKGSKNLGLRELLNQLQISNVTSNDIAFYIAPCINAAGRLDSPNIVMDLFLSDDIKECERLTVKLIDLNNKRKEIQKDILDNLLIDDKDNFLIIHIKENLPGIVGIIAGNVVEKYKKPCFCLCGDKHLHGSGRSIYGYSINKIIENNDFVNGGGHSGACGLDLDIENLDKLKQICNKDFTEFLNNNECQLDTIDIINEINFDIINEKLIKNIEKLQPFGNENEEPLFCTKNVIINSSKIMGKNKNVIKLNLKKDDVFIQGIGFNNIIEKFMNINKSMIDIVYTIQLNEFPKNVFTIQLLIKDIK